MYILIVAWLYVVGLMAVLEGNWVGALMTLLFYGALPLGILVYLGRAAGRRRHQRGPRSGP